MIQHQIVQSPARLGLTNPNSPSIQNPTPPKLPSSQFHHPQPHHQHASDAPSPALLSLLPPLPRAQALLLQMASLASKLFEVSPNRSLWVTAFRGSLPTFLSSQTQPQSSTSLESSPSSTKEILSLFTSLQTQIIEAVAELQKILDLQDVKQKVVREIHIKMQGCLHLLTNSKMLSEFLTFLLMIILIIADQRDKLHNFSVTRIWSRASSSSWRTPPAPQEEQMRASQLYNFADLDIGLPKVVETYGNESIWRIASSKFSCSTLVGSFGMPVELPVDLPIKPLPGWKPGDPVPLPSMDSLNVPVFNEQQLRPLVPLHKPPEVIQDQPVNLDLGGSDSSDYSSDEASTDDED
ncbi:hypothetical protein K1719_040801 [Acacia pycnantha]|nr:hypothetical protein K1719_040801 [Acacia pycnantha]